MSRCFFAALVTLGALLMLLVAGRVGVVTGCHGVGIAPAAVPILDANFAAAEIRDDLFGAHFSFALRRKNDTRPLSI